MNLTVWMCAAALVFSGSVYAQEGDDLEAQIDAEMTKYDTNKDGKVTRDEYKAVVKAESGIEDETSYDWLDKWKYSMIDFLAADSDDNLEATKAELLAYYKSIQAGDSEKMGKLTKKDISVLDDEYLEPAVAMMLKLFDTDGNGKVSQKEGDAAEMGEVVREYDTNKDGNLDGMEIKESEVLAISALYDVEEGYTLKGEPSTAEPAGPVEIPEKVRENFDSMDADKDGSVSKAEMKSAATTENSLLSEWWGVYIAFLSVDANDDMKIDIEEFYNYGLDENNEVKHKFYPVDKAEALKEIWGDLDTDKDSKVTKAEWDKLFPGTDEFGEVDTDASGDTTKDEFWNAFKSALGSAFEFPEKDRDTGGTTDTPTAGGGTPNPDDPMWDLYKKAGRSWTVKNSSKFMGMDNVSYTKTEVVSVAADHAVVRYTSLDKDKKAYPGMAPAEMKLEFKTAAGGTGTAPKIKDLGTETIKVEGGEFECTVTEVVTEAAGSTFTTKSWSSKKFLGLSVKSETTGKDMTSTTELVEFVE